MQKSPEDRGNREDTANGRARARAVGSSSPSVLGAHLADLPFPWPSWRFCEEFETSRQRKTGRHRTGRETCPAATAEPVIGPVRGRRRGEDYEDVRILSDRSHSLERLLVVVFATSRNDAAPLSSGTSGFGVSRSCGLKLCSWLTVVVRPRISGECD